MKLLFVSIDFPFPPNNGHRIRAWALLRSLAEEGHEVSVLTFAAPGEPSPGAMAAVRQICSEVGAVPLRLAKAAGAQKYRYALAALCSGVPYGVERFRSPEMAARIGDLLGGRRFDAAVFESSYALVNCPPSVPIPIILDNPNVEYVLVDRYRPYERNPARRAYAGVESRAMRRWEAAAWKRATKAIFCSGHDRRLCLENCADVAAEVVPNVIDIGGYAPAPGGDGSTLLYIGGMDWFPNRDAVEFFAFDILPAIEKRCPGAGFVVGGRGPQPAFRDRFRGLRVSFTGTVPEIRPVLSRADVCVVPLRIGSGTRLKILEAAAMGKAVVSTSVGAEGLEFEHGKEILIADRKEEFADAVIRLLTDEALRVSLGQAARLRVERQYTMEAMRRGLRTVLAGVGRRGATA